jgi:hypothetical protein
VYKEIYATRIFDVVSMFKNIMKITLTLIIIITTLSVWGQDANPFLGTWIKKGSKPSNVIDDPYLDTKFAKYQFRENGVVYYTNCYLERGAPGKYSLTNDNKLSLNYALYNIISFTENELLLSRSQDDTIQLNKIAGLEADQKDSISSSNIVYKTNYRLHPTLKTDINLYTYFFSVNDYMDQLSTTYNLRDAEHVLSYNIGSVYVDVRVRVNFIVDRKGNTRDIKILESSHPKKNSKVIDKIAKTSGHWIPSKLDGAFVDSEITLEFNKLGLKTIEKHHKADNIFLKAKKKYEKGDYATTVELLTEALSLNPTNQNYLLARAKAYFSMNKNEFGCEDLKRITDLEMIEVRRLNLEKCGE